MMTSLRGARVTSSRGRGGGEGGVGRRVKQARPQRCVSRDEDGEFRGVICRIATTFDGRQSHLNITADYVGQLKIHHFTFTFTFTPF